MKPKPKIYAVNAPAGSGKTYQAIRYALVEAATKKQKTVIVFKSIELLRQAQSDANAMAVSLKLSVQVHALHSLTSQSSETYVPVGSQIQTHLSQSRLGDGEILMITEAAYMGLQHWPNRWMWSCIFDEIPFITPAHQLNVPDNHHLLTDHLQLVEPEAEYSRLVATADSKSILQRYAENPSKDQISDVLSSVARHVVSPCFETYVRVEQYRRVKTGNCDPGARQLETFSLLQPSVLGTGDERTFRNAADQMQTCYDLFDKVIIMGASFSSSMLGLVWPAMDLEFEPFPRIEDHLRYTEHTCGSRLTIKFVFEARWSKYLRDKISRFEQQDRKNLDIFTEVILRELGGSFAYLVNKDIADQMRQRFLGVQAKQLPNAPWGLNMYQSMHAVVVMAALNPTPSHVKFLCALGLQGDLIRDALFHAQIYQAVMRCSLGNPLSKEPVTVLLPDRMSAEALGRMFPGCQVEKLDLDLVEPEPARGGRPKLEEPKSTKRVLRETRKRKRALDKEIKRIKAGGAVDVPLMEKFKQECRSNNSSWIKLKQLVAQNQKNNGSEPAG